MYKKKNDLALYDISPKVVPVGREVTFTLRFLDPDLLYGTVCHVDIGAINAFRYKCWMVSDVELTPLDAPQKGFTFKATFQKEQEYVLNIRYDNKVHPKGRISVYAVEDDLLYRTPLIGDFHGHTYFSDGGQGPAFVAAEYRRQGYDFVTITDHRRYHSSLRAIAAMKDLDIPFKAYPGEEVHPYNISTHIINFAGDKSANDYVLNDTSIETPYSNQDPAPHWEEEMQEILKTLDDVPEGVDPREIASAMIVTRIIREGGGLAILAHPHWVLPLRHVNDDLTRYFLKKGMFDALEVIGGLRWEENEQQYAFYQQLRYEEGLNIPIVGSSDQHSVLNWEFPGDRTAYFLEEKTLLLSHGNNREDIKEAIKNYYSVGLYQPDNNRPFIRGGNYRLHQYILFLLTDYFPLRDELYFSEGCLLHEYMAGVPGSREKLLSTVADHAYFEKKYFYREK